MLKISIKRILYVLCMIFTISCSAVNTPEQVNDGIQTANLSEFIKDSSKIEKLIKLSEEGKLKKQDSLLIMKDGKLIVEKYYGDWSRTKLHTVQSVSKGIVALYVGELINKKKIKSVDDKINTYLPEYKKYFVDGKDKITIKHLLTMTAGFSWNEIGFSYDDPLNDMFKAFNSSDSIAFTLSKKLRRNPGALFSYNGGSTELFSEILKNASKEKSLKDYLEKSDVNKIFLSTTDKLEGYSYVVKKDKRINLSGGFKLLPRNMAKIGKLVLDKGLLNDEIIINEKFIKDMTTSQIRILNTHKFIWHNYGYYWWIRDFKINNKTIRAVAARGIGGQMIVVIDQLNLVVVKTASNYDGIDFNDLILEKYIIPSFI